MNVLSLFDGMSCGQIALRELGVEVDKYFASEIDKFAIAQTQLNFPETIQLGDVRNVKACDLPKIDLLIGGSPCQGFSFAGKRLNFDDPRSALFFEFVRVLRECRERNPQLLFLLENVRMKRECERVISDTLGLQPVVLNSSLVSAQNRVRLYWTNIRTRVEGLFGEVHTDIPQPKDRGLVLADILEEEVPQKYFLSEACVRNLLKHKERNAAKGNGFGMDVCEESEKSATLRARGRGVNDLILQRLRGKNKGGVFKDKAPTLTSSAHEHNNYVLRKIVQLNPSTESNGREPYQQNRVYDKGGISPTLCSGHAGFSPNILNGGVIRRLTPTECARLQTIPKWYVWNCSETQQYKMLGNGWTVEMIKHIFSFI